MGKKTKDLSSCLYGSESKNFLNSALWLWFCDVNKLPRLGDWAFLSCYLRIRDDLTATE